MRIAIGGISHESSTLSTVPTTLQHFHERSWAEGDEIFAQYRDTKSALGGFIDAARDAAYEVVPTFYASAVPAGPVTAEATTTLVPLLCEHLRRVHAEQPLDGVLLSLHGAMVSELDDDGEAYILRAVREVIGPDMPLIVELDLHGNISPEMVDLVSIAVAYDEYPHTDPYERGYECGILMARIVRGGAKPTPCIIKVPMLTALQKQHTHADPMLSIKHLVHALENERGVLNISYLPGFPFADIPLTNFTIIVTTDNDPELARELASRIARELWAQREEFRARPMPVDDAVRHAMSASSGPLVLADIGDNPGGGSPADGTIMLDALLRLGAKKAVIVPIVDAAAVAVAQAAGEGAEIDVELGGHVDGFHGEPMHVRATVVRISDGIFAHKGPMNTGVEVNMGPTAVLEIAGNHGGSVQVVVPSLRYQPTDLEVLRSQGIEPTEQQIIVVKSSVHFRAAFTPVATEIVEVDTPGLTSPHVEKLDLQRVVRPIWPYDADMTWEP